MVEGIDELEDMDSDEEQKHLLQLKHDRMGWFELVRECHIEAEKEYIDEQCNIVREAIKNQFTLLQRVMKSWLSQAVKMCYVAWRDWTKTVVKSKKDAILADKKAIELKIQSAEQNDLLEQLEANKWKEGFDEFTERIFFEHIETGEIAWDEKPKRGFVMR